MAEAKTQPTDVSVEHYLAGKASPEQLVDCKALMAMCGRATQQAPVMWGPSIVGFGSYTYRYDSGRTGNAPLTGFAVRGKEIVIYLAEGPNQADLLGRLGKHKMGKSCLYFKRLAELDVQVAEQLISESVEALRRRYPDVDGA